MSNINMITGPMGRGNFIKLPYPKGQATYTMGSNSLEQSQPVREVTLTQPIAVQEAPVTVDEFRDHIGICESKGISHGRLVFTPDWQLANMLFADSKEAASKMAVEFPKGNPWYMVTDALQLVPTMEQFEARYARLADEGAAFLKGDHPAVLVSWPEVVMCASHYFGGRLLTGAEWEYAARTGLEGDDVAGMEKEETPIYNDGVHATVPVESHSPNEWGIRGMVGNVYEWVQDGWTDSYGDLPGVDPVAPLTSDMRVVRGGSGDSQGNHIYAAYRANRHMLGLAYSIGARVCVPQPQIVDERP